MAQECFDDLIEVFSFLEGWEDRYRHIIEMGKALPGLADAEKSALTRVEGCASQVWLVPEVMGLGEAAIFNFRGESDAIIVQGLIAVLQCLFSGRSVAEISAMDAELELGKLELTDHLSSQRSNGVRAMVKRIKDIAKSAME